MEVNNMIITLNGETREFKTPLTVTDLIKELNLESRLVLVERNMEVVQSEDMDGTGIVEGDSIEVLMMVGGGL